MDPQPGSAGGWLARIRTLWTRDPKGMSIDLLRVGMGLVWALNLIFILTPSNQYFTMFQSMAGGYSASSLGGAGFANWVAGSPTFFAWAIAILTAYLAVAFLAGFTTRFACVAGAVASLAFLLTQFYTTFALDGSGTDVGPHPLYLLVYLILFAAGAGQYFALDHWMWASGKARFPRLSKWVASPRDLPCNATCPAAGPRASLPSPAEIRREATVVDPGEVVPPTPPARRRGAILASLAVAGLLLVVGAAAAMHLRPVSPSNAAPSQVAIRDIQLQVNYPGGESQGGFGPSHQEGCWGCVGQVSPGASVLELEMLTDNQSGAPLTVTSVSVAPPFALALGPKCPQTVGAGQMWMFDVTLGTPTLPGDYTVQITVTTQ